MRLPGLITWPPSSAVLITVLSSFYILLQLTGQGSQSQSSYLVRPHFILDYKSQFQSIFPSPLNNIDVCMELTLRNVHQVIPNAWGAMLGSINNPVV